MWLIFENIEHRSDLVSNKGNKYSANLMTATKKGWDGAEDEPYSKPFFDDAFCTVISRNGAREAEMNAVEFFEACEPGDTVVMKQKQEGANKWKLVSLQNKTRDVLPESEESTSVSAPGTGVASGWDAAVNFVNVLVNNGHYKDKTDPEILLDAVVTYRMRIDALDSVALDADVNEYDDAA